MLSENNSVRNYFWKYLYDAKWSMFACYWLTKRPLRSHWWWTVVLCCWGSSELKCHHYELGHTRTYRSGRQCQLPPREWSRPNVCSSQKESNERAVTGYCNSCAKGSLNKQYHISLLTAYFSFWDLCQAHRHEGSQEIVICLSLIYFYNCTCQQWEKILKRKVKLAVSLLSS